MLPPLQTGETAISRQPGNSPNIKYLPHSIENEVLHIPDIYSRGRLIESVLVAYSGTTINKRSPESPLTLDILQDGIKSILIEHDKYLEIYKDDLEGIKERKRYVFEIVSYYFSAVFFQPHPPNLSELDFRLLNECIRRFNEDREVKEYSEICLHMNLDETVKGANFLRFAFSANVNKDLRNSAKYLLDAISDKCTLSGTKTVMVKSLRKAKNNFEKDKGGSGEIERIIENWFTNS
jgi:hypothetical protein